MKKIIKNCCINKNKLFLILFILIQINSIYSRSREIEDINLNDEFFNLDLTTEQTANTEARAVSAASAAAGGIIKSNKNKKFSSSSSSSSEIILTDSLEVCPESYFTCADGKCVPWSWRCDSKVDCYDGSDEKLCEHSSKCNEGQFQCNTTKKCIPRSWKCDQDFDCGTGDFSDELNCANDNDKCLPYQSPCKNGLCLEINKFCDGHWDCDSDEDNCTHYSKLCLNMSCSYECKYTSIEGPRCYCPPGQEPNGTLCKDFNECTVEGKCDQICINTFNSYECSCFSGYVKNGNRCFALNVPKGDNASLAFLTHDYIKRVHMTGEKISSYKNQKASAIEIWHRNSTLCAIYATFENPPIVIRCHKINNLTEYYELSLPEIMYSIDSIEQIRIDWISENLYFLSNELGLVFVCTNSLKHCQIILRNVVKPSSIALDPTKGFLFFTEWSASLSRALLDGTSKMNLVATQIYYPTGITLDLPNEHVYWIDAYTDFVERVDYDGMHRWSLKKGPENHLMLKALHSVEIFENQLYISSWHDTSIVSINKFKFNATRIAMNVKATDLRVFHRQKQPEVAHPCRNPPNGNCDQICIPLWKNDVAIAKCSCSAGYTLKNKNTCSLIKQDIFLIYGKQKLTSINGMLLNNRSKPDDEYSDAIVPIYNVTWPEIFDFSVKHKKIFFLETNKSTPIISSQKFDGSNRKSEIFIREGIVSSISYDYITDYMYWTSSYSIYVASLKNPSLNRTYYIGREAMSLAVDPENGFIFWTHWKSGENEAMIRSCWMDGSNRVTLTADSYQSMYWPYSITLNKLDKKIYWCDVKQNTIERMNLDGSKREVLFENKNYNPLSIALLNNFIYWVDDKNGTIMRLTLKYTESGLLASNKIFSVDNDRYPSIKMFDTNSQKETNDCVNMNCPGLCLKTPKQSVCRCSYGFSLNANGNNCTENNAQYNCSGFLCKESKKCIDRKMLCDGEYQCEDGSDEDFEGYGPCSAIYCDKDINFVCDNRCFQKSLLCNSVNYCKDGVDQLNCTTKICSDSEFTCLITKKCIPIKWVHDGAFDCGPNDNSDEVGPVITPECTEFKCKNGYCIPFVNMCDGENNCGDNSDEEICQCGENERYCVPSGCYDLSRNCDGIHDCLDFSDESNCTGVTIKSDNERVKISPTCDSFQFLCKSGSECISDKLRCDGIAQCFDESDEVNCSNILKPNFFNSSSISDTDDCIHPDRICIPSKKCVRVHELCDGKLDCEDGTDEGFRCSEKLCNKVMDCSHFCHNAPEGFVCSCPLHQFLQPNGLHCSMEHSCEKFGTCSQICDKKGRTYECKCLDGFELQHDKFSCKSKSNDTPYVIFSSRQEIRAVNLRTSAVKNFYSSLRNTIALDFLYTNDSIQIFWTDVQDDKIFRGTLIGDSITQVETVVQNGLSTAEGLAVDWIGMNLYWIDSNLDQIEVALVNGSFRRTLVAGDMESPRAISLDPREGLLFWTDWDENFPRIEQCSMAGEYRKTITQMNQVSGWPNGLTLDYENYRVYWVDARSDSIHTIKYDGSDHHLVIKDQDILSHPFAISLFENYVYWTDWRTTSVIRANKWNGSDIQVIQRTLTQPFDIQIVHSTRQPKDSINPCGNNNGNCSHLCLLSLNKSFRCECPHVMRLDSRSGVNTTCIPNEQVLLFVMGNEIRGIDLINPNHHTIPTISQYAPQRIDFLVEESKLFWSDIILNEIQSAGLSDGFVETIVNTEIQKPLGFAIDWISKIMFISSGKQSCQILACNLKGEYVTEIHNNLNVVESIVLDPVNGKLFWSHSDKENKIYRLEFSNLDGSIRRILFNSTYPMQSLSMDYKTNRIYFVQLKYTSGYIYYIDLATWQVEEILASDVMSISSVAVYNDSLYFPENIQSAIMSCRIANCSNTLDIIRKNTKSIHALKMFHLDAQKGENSCSDRNKNQCDHLCFAISNSDHICKCAIGFYQSDENSNNCIGKSEFIFYSISFELKGIEVISNDNPINDFKEIPALAPISRIPLATNIDYFAKENYLYWTDSEKGTISRVKRDGTNREVILNQANDQADLNNLDWLSGIAIDWVAGNIYWSDSKRNLIEVARLNGFFRYVVLINNEKPTILSVDPINGYLFYVVSDGKIVRTGLDGSLPFILVNQTKNVNSLALDIKEQKVYWCESTTNVIMRVDYDGNLKMVMLNHSLDNPVALALFDDYMLWADNNSARGSSINIAPIHNFSDFNLLLKSEGNPIKDLKIFAHQNGTNPCADDNGSCQELCLFNGTYPVCACSHGKVSENGKTCEEYDEFIIFSKGTSIDSIHITDHLNKNGPIENIFNHSFMRNVIGLSYDYEAKRIFYSDIHLNSINWVYFNGTEHTMIVNGQSTVEGLAFDSINTQLFWTSNNDASIRSLDLKNISYKNIEFNTKTVRQVIKLNSLDKPRGIAAEPCLAMIYWTNWNSQSPSIQRAYLTGYGLESIIKTEIRMPNAITLDFSENKLYWSDARLDKIERTDYDGKNRIILAHSTPKHPFGMAIYGDLLFWTDWVLHAVVRANKYSGADVVILRSNLGRPMGIAAIQNTTKNCDGLECKILNGGCEDVCILDKNGKASCACTRGVLASNKKNCIQSSVMKCPPAYFQCGSGECIPYQLTCDKVENCQDKSDELRNYCIVRRCPSDFFMCNNHRCIFLNQTCDGAQNCGDGSDEASSLCGCPIGKFKCSSGECFLDKYKCDNVPDCPDASDEKNCPKRECSQDNKTFLPCNFTTACYLPAWRCDNENDCWDGSDEEGCENVTKPACGIGQFRCANGPCINQKWRCDSEKDCSDNSDELNCSFDNIKCKSNEFKCGSTCIPSTWQCDGTPDCQDGSDEGSQCARTECKEFMFKCNSSGRCIPQKWVCDGEPDCIGKEDEKEDCAIISVSHIDQCPPPNHLCTNGLCLEQRFICDGDSDCEDNSDEFECGTSESTCLDENCKNITNSCTEPDYFQCLAGACVSIDKLCNSEPDCGENDWSDEEACNINECDIPDICEHTCLDLKVGYKCECSKGYKQHHSDKHLCEDIDECSEKICSQRCYNTYGSYHCACMDGYELKNENTCKSTSDEKMQLIFSNRYYIRTVNEQGKDEILVHQLTNAVALDFHWKTKCLFWSDVTAGVSSIKKYCPDTNKTTALHQSLLQNPDGLAIDWIAENLYWCDKGLDTIEVSKLDGRFRNVLINKNLRDPRAISLDPYNKHIYWSDWGDSPYIGMAGMDGSAQKVIIEDNLGWPNALTVSFETNELFFGDARGDYIAVSDLNGKNIKIIMSRSKNPDLNLHHVFAIAVWEDHLYWSDWEKKSIERCNKYDGKNCSTLITTIHRPMDIRVYHPYRQIPIKNGSNPCDFSNCSTLCLLSPNPPYYRCMCPSNFILDPKDNKTCLPNCTSAHFLCIETQKCIPFYFKCDGENDCGDMADEPENCPKFNCEPGQFQCANSKCIYPYMICDGSDNCGDLSDEKDCNDFTCFDNSFKCPHSGNRTAFCIPNERRCDGIKDCTNGEDEFNCTPISCLRNQFLCGNNRCIPQVWVCDGDADCPGREDENSLNCNADRVCSGKEFKCRTGRCIPSSWRCDGEEDCPNAEDEFRCDLSSSCEPTYFKCNNSKCIPGRWKCDYENDCGDGSDEIKCDMRNCSESEFRCNSSGKCIKFNQRCDGETHCDDNSDEQNCNKTCSDHEFKCGSTNTCINKIFKCDGDEDCPDGSDEVNCTCSHDQFSCANNKQCIFKRWLCDGFADCTDKSDESLETCALLPCHSTAFKCPNLLCIRNYSLCDGVNDCGDGSDESNFVCSSLPKCRYDQFQCEDHVCISAKFRCDGKYNCADGSDEINCKPAICRFGTCSQVCVEKKASYACKCSNSNYKKGVNKNDTCEAIGVEKILLLASEQEFRFIFPQKHEGSAPMIGFFQTGSIKIDVFDILILNENEALIFWIDSHHNKIHKMKISNLSEIDNDENNEEKKISKRDLKELTAFNIPNLADPKSLAVDWITSLIYVIDSKHDKIIVTDILGKHHLTLVETGMDPTDLVLDPESRLMVWSTLESGILVASLDGSNKRSLVETDVGWPISLSIDYPTSRLYWADYRKGTIETCLLNGKDRQLVRHFPNNEKPQKIDVFEDFIYIKLYDQSIIRMNKFGHNNGTYLLKGYRSSDIGVIHPAKQNKNISNPCSSNPCENQGAVCVLSETNKSGYSCKCPINYVMLHSNDKAECRSMDEIPSYCPLKCRRGKCKLVDHVPKCICHYQFDGKFCQHYRCSGFCVNRGICTIDLSNYSENSPPPPLKCTCPPNWSGARCETSVPDCQSRCHNGGQCLILDEGIQKCVCPPSFVGEKCEHCFNLTCLNRGICRETNTGSLQCDCPDGFIGKKCEINVCSNVCQNGGECSIELQLPRCKCLPRFEGNFCETDLCLSDSPPTYCDSPSEPVSNLCSLFNCLNGGYCHIVKNEALCNCTSHFNGRFCEKPVENDNPCIGYCANGGICKLDELLLPNCVCIGEWGGEQCNNPPSCLSECGICRAGNSINECLCDDGTISNCIYDNNEVILEQRQHTAKILTILTVLLSIIIFLLILFGGAIFFLRRIRVAQPFSHARLNDNVEITNPMYLGDIDEVPSFVHEDNKGNFANPVYESMYAGMPIEDQGNAVEMNCSSGGQADERKGLLQHSNEETSTQDIL